MHNLLTLRTAIRPTGYWNPGSPISHHELRIKQYESGLARIRDEICNLPSDMEIALIDNTISSPDDLPSNMRNLLPASAHLLLSKTNSFGRFNKGAGDIQVWRKYKTFLRKYSLIFHFEPKLQILDISDFSRFLSHRSEHVERAGLMQVKTGHFVISSDNLVNFAQSVNLPKMLLTRTSIESLLFSNLVKKKLDITAEPPWTSRYEPTSGNWESY